MEARQIKKGFFNPKLAARYVMNRVTKKLGQAILRRAFDNSGMQILDRDWDTLLIFDCGRYDMFENVIDSPGSLSKECSMASVTAHFVERNFSERQAHDIVYLSANPLVGRREEYLDIFKFVGVRHETRREKRGQENTRGLVDPEPVIKKAKDLHDEYPNKRHIVHFLPPHTPHMFKSGGELENNSQYRNYEAVRGGNASTDEMRNVYAENLQYAIEQALDFTEDINGKVAMTADHGELLGEGVPLWMKACHTRWGNQWQKYDWGHYSNMDVPELRDVPWFELPVDERREIKTESPVDNEYDTQNIEEKLKALGYKT
jgi:hypothetical protein